MFHRETKYFVSTFLKQNVFRDKKTLRQSVSSYGWGGGGGGGKEGRCGVGRSETPKKWCELICERSLTFFVILATLQALRLTHRRTPRVASGV